MEDADPDTRLARELHRELNGLTRQRRGRPQPAGAGSNDRQKGHVAAHGPHGKPKQKRSHSSSHDKQHSKRRRSSDGDEAHAPSSKPHVKKEQPTASDSSNSTSRPGRHTKAGDTTPSKAATASPQAKPKHTSSKQQQPRQQGSDNSGHSQRLLPHYQPPQQQHMPPPPAAEGGPNHHELALRAALPPDAAAAATAAQQVKRQMAEAADHHHLSEADSEDLVKVFYAGVPWGTALPRAELSSRLRLARALNEAFVGDILSVGRGAALVVVFVDAAGCAVEVAPPLDSGSKRRDGESEQWRSLSAKAVRLYVRGLADEAAVVQSTTAT